MIVVAIDGPSGVGKSTVGKALAASLGVPYLDTGAMYRAVGLLARRKGLALPITEADDAGALAEQAEILVTGSGGDVRTFLDGEDVSAEIREPEISRYASAVAAIPRVRRRLAARQRELALAGGGVLEGRDIGTRVVPEAAAKFFLTARPEVRARRRYEELVRKGTPRSWSPSAPRWRRATRPTRPVPTRPFPATGPTSSSTPPTSRPERSWRGSGSSSSAPEPVDLSKPPV